MVRTVKAAVMQARAKMGGLPILALALRIQRTSGPDRPVSGPAAGKNGHRRPLGHRYPVTWTAVTNGSPSRRPALCQVWQASPPGPPICTELKKSWNEEKKLPLPPGLVRAAHPL
jgi:hypothetical protein